VGSSIQRSPSSRRGRPARSRVRRRSSGDGGSSDPTRRAPRRATLPHPGRLPTGSGQVSASTRRPPAGLPSADPGRRARSREVANFPEGGPPLAGRRSPAGGRGPPPCERSPAVGDRRARGGSGRERLRNGDCSEPGQPCRGPASGDRRTPPSEPRSRPVAAEPSPPGLGRRSPEPRKSGRPASAPPERPAGRGGRPDRESPSPRRLVGRGGRRLGAGAWRRTPRGTCSGRAHDGGASSDFALPDRRAMALPGGPPPPDARR